ncbi:hypothetical protein RFI_38453 [Reticulomyxa filosa]|uniref:Uncharacterized protein n=1 Tax=Reticulomyxa filosa TaxID=46433 RepID=X6LD35_RETFI|nr:hypothetical protein RFI_38453 [Reticulomyxa filosa]|eukprot:ETN99036.1 hypothetical protein RFI_38453 [Reticulomyxa filosa]
MFQFYFNLFREVTYKNVLFIFNFWNKKKYFIKQSNPVYHFKIDLKYVRSKALFFYKAIVSMHKAKNKTTKKKNNGKKETKQRRKKEKKKKKRI